MKAKKLLALLLTFMLVFGIAACTSKTPADTTQTTEKPATESLPEPYTIKYMTGGPGKQADSDVVLSHFNKKLQEYLPNTFLDFEVVPFGEYKERWQLVAAAGEQIDIAWLGWMQSLSNEVNNGSYMELDDVIEQYAPALWDVFQDWVWDLGRISGKLYSIPVGLGWSSVPSALYIPTELADKYMDLEAFKTAQLEWEKSGIFFPSEDLLDVIEDFLAKAKAGGDLNMGISTTVFDYLKSGAWYIIHNDAKKAFVSAYTKGQDESSKVYSILDEDKSYFFERTAKWYKEGYIRKDALTVIDEKPDIIADGSYKDKLIIEAHKFEDISQLNFETKWGMPCTVLPLRTYSVSPTSKHGTAATIPSTNGNIKRTLEFVDLLWSEKGGDFVTLLAYGIEGIHYEKGEGNIITTFEYDGVGGGSVDDKYGIPDWTVASARYSKKNQGYHPTMVQDRVKQDAAAIKLPLAGFSFDSEPVKLEISQHNAITSEYVKGLTYGTYADPIAAYEEMKKRLEAAGVRNIAVELQKQIDEFMATKQ